MTMHVKHMEEETGMKEIFGLDGEPALVVGGGYGIGKETALLLAKVGARVAVADLDPERAQAVADEIGGIAVSGDVTDEAAARAIVDEAHDKLGGLTRLVNIVGITKMKPFLETTSQDWEFDLKINLLQQMYVCHAAGRYMTKTGGAIALVGSVSGHHGARLHVAYGAAKAGVHSMARALADEWGRYGIRVNSVLPDKIATPRHVASGGGTAEEFLAAWDASGASAGVPLRRGGRPHEIALPLLFFLSDMSSFVSGQSLAVDGGMIAHFPHNLGPADV